MPPGSWRRRARRRATRGWPGLRSSPVARRTAGVAEEQGWTGLGRVAAGRLEQRDVERAFGRRPGLPSGCGGSPQLDAQTDDDGRLLGLEEHGYGEVRVVVGDDRQPYPALVV